MNCAQSYVGCPFLSWWSRYCELRNETLTGSCSASTSTWASPSVCASATTAEVHGVNLGIMGRLGMFLQRVLAVLTGRSSGSRYLAAVVLHTWFLLALSSTAVFAF